MAGATGVGGDHRDPAKRLRRLAAGYLIYELASAVAAFATERLLGSAAAGLRARGPSARSRALGCACGGNGPRVLALAWVAGLIGSFRQLWYLSAVSIG